MQAIDTKQTSLLAYQNMQDKIPNDETAILGCLEFNSDLTYKEIGKILRWNSFDPNKVSRRMKALVLSGKVEISGRKICPIAKSLCTTYKLKV